MGFEMNLEPQDARPDDVELDLAVIAIAQIVHVQAVKERWKAMSTEFSAYYIESRQIYELAMSAKNNGAYVKISYSQDGSGRYILHSMVLTNDSLPPKHAQDNVESPRPGYLF